MPDDAARWVSPVGPVKYHMQDDAASFCGPATLMMVLQYAEALRPSTPPVGLVPQSDAYEWMHDASGWDVSPARLAAGLNHYKSTAVTASFCVQLALNPLELAAFVVSAMYWPDALPPIVLINQWNHWIVVVSVCTNIDPAGGSFFVTKFRINDPGGEPAGSGIPPHAFGDLCGSGGVYYSTRDLFWQAWNKDVVQSTIPVSGLCIGVFSDVSATIGTIQEPPPSRWTARYQRVNVRDRLITAQEAGDAALSAIVEHSLARPLARLSAGPAHIVQRIDRAGSYYYIVPISDGTAFFAVMLIDAWDGEPLIASYEPADAAIADSVQVNYDVRGIALDPHFGLGRELPFGGYSVSPVLVWRPCVESSSPFQPFHQIAVGGRVLFRDVRGTIHAALTDKDPFR